MPMISEQMAASYDGGQARGINLCDLAPPSRGEPMEMPQTTICGAGIESIRRKIRWYFENVSCGHECRPRAPAASITSWINIPRSSQLPISSRRSMVTIRPIGAPKNA
jgi:hypothetical protein